MIHTRVVIEYKLLWNEFR